MLRRNGFWLLMVVLFFGAQFFVKRELVSGKPPPIQALTLAGEVFDLELFEGRPSLIYFWASWCGICGAMDQAIADLSREQSVMTIAMQSGDRDELNRYMKEEGLEMPVVVDELGELSRQYGVQAVPAIFILDRSGQIRFSTMGYTTSWGIRLRLWLAGL